MLLKAPRHYKTVQTPRSSPERFGSSGVEASDIFSDFSGLRE